MKQIKIALMVWAMERVINMLLALGAVGMALWFLHQLTQWRW